MATRRSKQMKQIIEILNITDQKHLEFAKREFGMFSVTHIASMLHPDVYYDKVTPSQYSSIYRTLATLVDRGEVVKKAHKQEGCHGRLPTVSYTYHLTEKFEKDMQFLALLQARWEAGRAAREEAFTKRLASMK